MKSATIFGGGSKDRTTKEYIETEKIGELLAQSEYKVKSGGYYGIMEAISKVQLKLVEYLSVLHVKHFHQQKEIHSYPKELFVMISMID
jgi:predicted Rossmann-fold nucleotide-binding protein